MNIRWRESKNKKCCKREAAVKKVFKGVSLDSFTVDEKLPIMKMNYTVGEIACMLVSY